MSIGLYKKCSIKKKSKPASAFNEEGFFYGKNIESILPEKRLLILLTFILEFVIIILVAKTTRCLQSFKQKILLTFKFRNDILIKSLLRETTMELLFEN
ncbi:hypothetical protein CVD28_27205 [Bacillus sp. M6-12]|nr:hypothetical protein CVD28_27205 [Bacillus sp. M6-12]